MKYRLMVPWALVAAGMIPQVALGENSNWTHYGLRPLGMGNAFVAVADDYNAIFYNPAGLARLKSWQGELINPSFTVSANTVNAVSDVADFATSSSGDGTDAVLSLLEGQMAKNHHIGFGWTPHLVFNGFGAGIGLDFGATMAVHRDISVRVDAGPQVIAPITIASNFFEDRLSIGGSLKAVARGGVDHEFSIADISAFSGSSSESDAAAASGEQSDVKLDDFVVGGYGIGADVGLMFTPVKTMEPTLGISIMDLGGTRYTKADISGASVGAPDTRQQSVNVGVSVKPIASDYLYLLATADAQQINQAFSYTKKLNAGVELGLLDMLRLQAGLHQGYLSAGVQFDLKFWSYRMITLRAVTYSEELGTVAGANEDRRYAAQIKILM